MTNEYPISEIDHINLDPSDNCWTNLRLATHSQNGSNKRRAAGNTSGFKGVSWDKNRKKWAAKIKVKGKAMTLGRFNTAETAYDAYCDAARKHFGQFARTA